jgi:hypothetical protein
VVQGLEFKVRGVWFRVHGLRFRVQGLWLRVKGSRFTIWFWGLGFSVKGRG